MAFDNKSALIVDDSATARAMLAGMLHKLGLHTHQSPSAEAAIDSLHHQPVDLIFLDHLMPGMDGFQALRHLKNHPRLQRIPVIMFTSQNARKYREEARALGAFDVISKQVDRDELALLTERALLSVELDTDNTVAAAGTEALAPLTPGPAETLTPPIQTEVPSVAAPAMDPDADLVEEARRVPVQLRLSRHRILIGIMGLGLLWCLWQIYLLRVDVQVTQEELVATRTALRDTVEQINGMRRHTEQTLQQATSRLQQINRANSESRAILAEVLAIMEQQEVLLAAPPASAPPTPGNAAATGGAAQ